MLAAAGQTSYGTPGAVPAETVKPVHEAVVRLNVPALWALAGVLVVAFGVRLWATLTYTYVWHLDETFQYLEQGHRLAFGSGVVPWEYHDGIRSWLLPTAIASLMRAAAVFTDSPQSYVLVVRLANVALSLAVPYVAFRFAERQFGLAPAVVAGLLSALSYDLICYAPVVMSEEPSAHVALLALWFGDTPTVGCRLTSRRAALSGALLGLSVCLRFQYAPALAIAVASQQWRDPYRLLLVGGAALAVLALGSGLIDAVTWGAPFQSIWLNFQRNAIDGISGAMGVQPLFYLPLYFVFDWGLLFPLFMVIAVLGALRAPAFAIAAIGTVALHSLTPHKEVRFIYLALAAAEVAAGLGIAQLVTLSAPRHRTGACAVASLLVVLLCATQAVVANAAVMPVESLRRQHSTARAFLAAHDVPGVCGLGVGQIFVYRTGGYTHLHRDVPIYFETFQDSLHTEDLTHNLSLSVVWNGTEIQQYPKADFAAVEPHFDLLITAEGASLPGFSRLGCFGKDTLVEAPICLFRRPGGCD